MNYKTLSLSGITAIKRYDDVKWLKDKLVILLMHAKKLHMIVKVDNVPSIIDITNETLDDALKLLVDSIPCTVMIMVEY